jgi:hypothetical protein
MQNVTKTMSDKIDGTMQRVSLAFDDSVHQASAEAEEIARDESEFIQEQAVDMLKTASLPGQLAQAVMDSDEEPDKDESVAEKRLKQFGDPSASVKSHDNELSIYDYPKALRKYI